MVNTDSINFKIRLKHISDYNDLLFDNIMSIGINKMSHISIQQKILLSSLIHKAIDLHNTNIKLIKELSKE